MKHSLGLSDEVYGPNIPLSASWFIVSTYLREEHMGKNDKPRGGKNNMLEIHITEK